MINNIKKQSLLEHQQHLIDGALVAFINHIGIEQRIDYTLDYEDL